MNNKHQRHLAVVVLQTLLLLGFFASTACAEKKADVPDGDRSIYVHRMPLLDENKRLLQPDATAPFSVETSCDACHSVDEIRQGLHFNAGNPDFPSGRICQPWIYVDTPTGTQIPISLRGETGLFRPEDIGLNARDIIEQFGRHIPGGIEPPDGVSGDEAEFWKTHGGLEINCLACHDVEFGHDQAEAAEHIERGNFRWAAVATAAFARVKGRAGSETLPPEVWYDPSRFDPKNKITLDLVREVPAQRCYFCHSHTLVGDDAAPVWQSDEDVHLTAGMTCTDCHRNGLDHRMIRGYPGEAQRENRPAEMAAFTCEGCHLGDADIAGRLGAPRPEHHGMPPVHFDKLSCTTCHSGPVPTESTRAIKTSRSHALGLHTVSTDPELMPHITGPVFAPGHDGKLTPHMLIWPAYWAQLHSHEEIIFIAPEEINQYAGDILRQVKPAEKGRWPHLSRDVIMKVLAALKPHYERPVGYICGGQCYTLEQDSEFTDGKSEFLQPVLWPWAHTVRPAQQSLGSGGCDDCHTADNPFFFGQVAVAAPTGDTEPAEKRLMAMFAGIDARYIRLFNQSFIFRPMLKVVCIAASIFIGGVLLLYGLRALRVFCRWTVNLPTISTNDSSLTKPRFPRIVALLWPAVFVIAIFLGATGLWAALRHEPLSGYMLMAHVSLGPPFATCMTLLVLLRAQQFVLTAAGNRRFVALVRCLMFWLAALATLPVILSITVSMFDWFGTDAQRCWIAVHRYSSIALGVSLPVLGVLNPLCRKSNPSL